MADFLHEIIEVRMRDKPTRGRRKIQMLHDLANDDGYVALKRAAEDRKGWGHRGRMSKTCCSVQQKTTADYNAHTYIQTQSQIKTNVLCVAEV